MSQPHTVLSSRSSISSSPPSSVSSIDSALISDSISNEERHRSNDASSYTSSSSSEPMAPWNFGPQLPDIQDGNGNILNPDPNDLSLYAGHTRWKEAHGQHRLSPNPPPQTLGAHYRSTSAPVNRTNGGQGTLHRRTKSKTKHSHDTARYDPYISADLLVIIIFCFALACFLVCLARPAFMKWFSYPAQLSYWDE